jgi:glycosyltransferase involved in cell wall biosynthesis
VSAVVRAIAKVLFWTGATTIAATYAGIPVLLLARGRLVRRPVRSADITPRVSVVIAAHDEAAAIGAKVGNLLALDYPADRLQVLIASDGSTDATVAIARAAGGDRVDVLDLPRVGKAAALNTAIERATGEIVVFSDANSMFEPAALRALVRPFADAEVGGVAGDQRYDADDGRGDGAIAHGERGYWDLDRLLKVAESESGSVISATGAIYALRRELVPTIIDGVTDDFYASTAAIVAGRRLVFAEDAASWEPVAASGGDEYGRKVRVMTRGLRGVVARRELLDPRRTGFYAVQLLWHKVLRRVMVVPLIAVAVSSPILATRSRLLALATAAQVAFYGLAAAGFALRERPEGRSKLLSYPAYFCLVNLAALQALLNVVRGHQIARREPRRPADASNSAPAQPAAAATAPLELTASNGSRDGNGNGAHPHDGNGNGSDPHAAGAVESAASSDR